jgi:hypothetical protein
MRDDDTGIERVESDAAEATHLPLSSQKNPSTVPK